MECPGHARQDCGIPEPYGRDERAEFYGSCQCRYRTEGDPALGTLAPFSSSGVCEMVRATKVTEAQSFRGLRQSEQLGDAHAQLGFQHYATFLE